MLLGLACGRVGFERLGPDAGVDANVPGPDATLLDAVFDAGSTSSCVHHLASGSDHACILMGGVVRCWGSAGQLGGAVPSTPGEAVAVGEVPAAIHVGAAKFHTCALFEGGAVWCWGGDNLFGQLGSPTMPPGPNAYEVAVPPGVAQVGAGRYHSCARAADAVYCWGSNARGQLGDGTSMDSYTPVAVRGIGPSMDVDTGGSATCVVVDPTGDVWCWGDNEHGQLGDGTTTASFTPIRANITDVVDVAAGGGRMGDQTAAMACAIKRDRTLWCWGDNAYGQLGDGTTIDRPEPVEVIGVTDPVAVTIGRTHVCTLEAAGTARCWGGNDRGQLGDGTLTNSALPVAVSGLTDVVHLAAGGWHTCAALRTGEVACWGSNSSNQLGPTALPESPTPVVAQRPCL
jgi:alpha-tubulin suppressor-like RCC1 family protein